MIYAIFFVVGALFGAIICQAAHGEKEEKGELILPQGIKRETIDAYVKNVWNETKEEGAVIMPERADISNKDLKIDDLLQ